MTLPREVSEALAKYAIRMAGGDQAHDELAALESAILSSLSAAREGALREAVRVAETEEELDGEIPDAVRWAAYRDPAGTLRGAVRATKRGIADRILALASRPETARLLAKHQPCGCVVCTCENEVEPDRCHGCGAKFCDKHAPRPAPRSEEDR